MKHRKKIVASALSLVITGVLVAGPLNPPAGPVASTFKTLSEVEPRIAINATNTPGDSASSFRITQPGSYYLTGNVTGVAGKHGIFIAVANVTIDLNGFTVQGAAGTASGIISSSQGQVVMNGTVTGWGGVGVTLGSDSRVRNVTSRLNNADGISVANGGVVESCAASSNGGQGISIDDNGVVRGCTASFNGENGIDGNASTRFENCVATDNGGYGIKGGNLSVVASCTADANRLAGIRVIDQSSVFDSSASSNFEDGISVTSGGHVSRCSAFANTLNGISAGSGCRIEDNHCRSNGFGPEIGSGILIRSLSSRTTVRNNTVANSDFGIKVDSTNHLIIGNTVATNGTNFEIVAGNRVGIILSLAASTAISGSTGGTAISSPDANFAY